MGKVGVWMVGIVTFIVIFASILLIQADMSSLTNVTTTDARFDRLNNLTQNLMFDNESSLKTQTKEISGIAFDGGPNGTAQATLDEPTGEGATNLVTQILAVITLVPRMLGFGIAMFNELVLSIGIPPVIIYGFIVIGMVLLIVAVVSAKQRYDI